MGAEHVWIGPVIEEIDAAVADKESGAERLSEATALFRQELVDHLAREERSAVPVVESVMTQQDWKAFSKHQQKPWGSKQLVSSPPTSCPEPILNAAPRRLLSSRPRFDW